MRILGLDELGEGPRIRGVVRVRARYIGFIMIYFQSTKQGY